MNVHVEPDKPTLGEVLGDFSAACHYQAWFVTEGWDTLQHAADYMQWLAELWGLVEQIGQHAVQAIMADAFGCSESA